MVFQCLLICLLCRKTSPLELLLFSAGKQNLLYDCMSFLILSGSARSSDLVIWCVAFRVPMPTGNPVVFFLVQCSIRPFRSCLPLEILVQYQSDICSLCIVQIGLATVGRYILFLRRVASPLGMAILFGCPSSVLGVVINLIRQRL